jgi:hypothetical protein
MERILEELHAGRLLDNFSGGRLAERWPSAWSYLKEVTLTDTELVWRWDRKKLRSAWMALD